MTGHVHSVAGHMKDQSGQGQVFKVLSLHDFTGAYRERLPKRWWKGLDLHLKNTSICSHTVLWKSFRCRFEL